MIQIIVKVQLNQQIIQLLKIVKIVHHQKIKQKMIILKKHNANEKENLFLKQNLS